MNQRSYILLLVFHCCSFTTIAQQNPARIRFEHFSVADGLPENSVYAILQDHLGYVWLGTQNGLVRYDGSKLTPFQYKASDPATLKGKQIRALLEDKKGDIWIASENLFRYERATQRFIEYPRKKAFTPGEATDLANLYEDEQGCIWRLFANRAGKASVERFDPKTNSWNYFSNIKKDAAQFDGESIAADYLNAGFTIDKNGKIWAITASDTENKLYWFDKNKDQFVRYIPNDLSKEITTDLKEISGISCDKEGQLWLSSITGKGLFRLNPVNGKLVHYKKQPNNSNSLAGDTTSTVYQDHKGFIWISTNLGLDKLDIHTGNFTHYIAKEDDPSTPNPGLAYKPVESSNGNVWFVTYNVLNCYNAATNTFIRYKEDEKNEDGLSIRFGIMSTMIDRSGLLWVGTDIAGLNKETRVNKFSLIKNDPKNPNSLHDEDVTPVFESGSEPGVMWFGTKTGLERLDKKTGTYSRYMHDDKKINSLSEGEVVAITEDKAGRFWIATNKVLNLMDKKNGTFTHFRHDPSNANSLMHDYILTISSFSDGKLWIGTSQGLDLFDYDNNLFTHYYKADSTYSPEVFNLVHAYTTADRMVAAIIHPGNNEDSTVPFKLASAGDFLVTAMGEVRGRRSDYGWIEDASGKIIWDMDAKNSPGDGKGNIRTGIIHLAAGNYQLRYRSDAAYAYGSWNFCPPYHPNLWGIQISKVSAGEAEKFDQHVLDRDHNGLGAGVVYCLTEDSKKNILIGTGTGGLTKFDPTTGKFISYVDQLNGPYIITGSIIEEKETGNLWMGDYFHGLLLLNKDGKLARKYDMSNGLSSNTVFGMVQDTKGILWISTNNGICRLDPKTEKILQFTQRHGLQGLEFSPMSFFNTSGGEIYFGGLNGVNSFYPGDIKIDTIAPQIILTGLDISGKPATPGKDGQMPVDISIASDIQLVHDQNDLTFHFTSIHYTRGDESQFAYKLSPNDKDWVQAGSLRQVRYTDLSPGTYTFYVKACNADGIWNEKAVSVSITILPPWWKTWWAYSIYIITLIAGIFGFIAYRSAALRKENKLLEDKVALRTDQLQTSIEDLKAAQAQLIQSEKMASLGELTTGIAHEIQNPLNFVNNFSHINAELIDEMKEEIEKGNMEEVSALANDIGENEKKITRHGKRAESIVKGMLEHSRSGNVAKGIANINKLTDEYLRLAHHGFLSKDKSFHVIIRKDFDESIADINIVPGNIGKVILNVINNAFYAVNEKHNVQRSTLNVVYEPTVSISTKKAGDKILISVTDNGNGIPGKILGKIFQPFFTTKPTGEFTGLGLYLSYDIVKAHGGELKVETKEGEGTVFIIQLPIV